MDVGGEVELLVEDIIVLKHTPHPKGKPIPIRLGSSTSNNNNQPLKSNTKAISATIVGNTELIESDNANVPNNRSMNEKGEKWTSKNSKPSLKAFLNSIDNSRGSGDTKKMIVDTQECCTGRLSLSSR